MDKNDKEMIELFRAVGVRELESIKLNKAFLPGANSLEARQFAFTKTEVLKFAETDKSKIMVVKTIIPIKILDILEFSDDVDPNIFKNGVITVQPEKQDLFNKAIISIEFLERIDEFNGI